MKPQAETGKQGYLTAVYRCRRGEHKYVHVELQLFEPVNKN